MGLSTITQPPFRVTLKSELLTYLNSFTDGALIFCDEDAQWYFKKGGIIITEESGFFGQLFMVNNAIPTPIVNVLNYAKVLGTTIQGDVHNFTQTANNKMTCTSVVSKTYVIDASCAIIQPNGNNQTMYLAIFKNGVLIPSSEKSFSNSTTNQILDINTGCIISLTLNDYIEVFVKNTTGLNAILVKSETLKIN